MVATALATSRWRFASLLLFSALGLSIGSGCGGGSGGTEPVSAPPPAPGQPDGKRSGSLIVSGRSNEAHRVTLGTGQMAKMPLPDQGVGQYQVYWSGHAAGRLLLLHHSVRAFFYDAATLEKAAPDFELPGALASMRGAKVSQDGEYFAACWNGDGSESIGLFRVGGGYVGKLATPTNRSTGSCVRFAWLSNQRLIYDSVTDVVVTNGNSSQDVRYPYPTLPAGWTLFGSQFAVDRAEQRIIWTAQLPMVSVNALLQVLVIANLDGTSPRQLTDHPESAKTGPTRAWHANAAWSPDGRFVAFNRVTEIAAPNPIPGRDEWVGSCTPVIILSADAGTTVIDPYGVSVDESLLYTEPSTGKHLQTCGPLIWME